MPYPNQEYVLEVKHRPAVPDNMRYWQVFRNDKQIESFLQSKDEFQDDNIDLESEVDRQIVEHFDPKRQLDNLDVNTPLDKVVNKPEFLEIDPEKEEFETLQLKDNIFPRGLAPLEELFDFNDVGKNSKIEPLGIIVEDCNLGIEKEPTIIKLSKSIPTTEKQKYISLFKEFSDVSSWSYEDLKTYDTETIQHKIPIKEVQKRFKQKLRRINLVLMPLIEKEIKRIYDSKIIVPLRYSKWVSNIVPTRKKTDEIRLCIDFRNLNKVSLKDNYPLLKMDHILQKVVRSSRISLLYGFSDYNQVLAQPED